MDKDKGENEPQSFKKALMNCYRRLKVESGGRRKCELCGVYVRNIYIIPMIEAGVLACDNCTRRNTNQIL